jgi:hypothetical protein
MKYFFTIALIFGLLSCHKIKIKAIDKIANSDLIVASNVFYLQANMIDANEAGISQYGHCWSQQQNPSVSNSNHTSLTSYASGDVFKSKLFGVSLNKTYYYRPYAISKNDTSYFEQKTFCITKDDLASNAVRLNTVDILSKSTVRAKASFNALEQFNIPSYGVCYGTSSLPTVSNHTLTHAVALSDITTTSDTVQALTWGIPYFARAFVQFEDGTIIYSPEITFQIEELKVNTVNYTISNNVATLQGQLEQLGVGNISDHGFCWSTTTSTPTYNSQKIQLGSTNTLGYFYGNLPLNTNTTYYFRSYAIIDNELKYGAIITIVN